ncbi:hypothetical protein [Thalassococcus sp. S3]|uniref:hypothetical protein n=1 Tax=Thalassococcus sp. S3 TaxID=2017482 RepID=UPI0010246437|nr:hypothetical protein [Thalassococcus sp. S3]QBF34092.1 hypothetical protein CFI11_23200 [Thalassococcus sp. S3]
MKKKLRLLAMSAGTAACALSIGYVMQMGETAYPVSTLNLESQMAVMEELEPIAPTSDGFPLNLEDITLTSAQADLPDTDGTPEADFSGVVPELPQDPVAPQLVCDVSADAEPMPGAMVRLSVRAPCYVNSRLTVHHSGMMFTAVTGADGDLDVDVPALAEAAVFIVAFENGEGSVAQTEVPTLRLYDRVGLQWSGKSGLQIHAREFGATYGEAGHVWSGAADAVYGGFVVRLGDIETLMPRMVEIYTFPSATADRAGLIALSVEAEITEATCGREVEAQALEMRSTGDLRTRDLVLPVPNCTAVGDFLVLNNLLDDLKIAAK